MISNNIHNNYTPDTLPSCFVKAHIYATPSKIKIVGLAALTMLGVSLGIGLATCGIVFMGTLPTWGSILWIVTGTVGASMLPTYIGLLFRQKLAYANKNLDSEDMLSFYNKEFKKENPDLERFWLDYSFAMSLVGKETKDCVELEEGSSN